MSNTNSGCLGILFSLFSKNTHDSADDTSVESSEEIGRFPYEAKPILTKGEKAFFDVLDSAIGHKCRILMKVRMIDLIDVKPHQVNRGTYSNKVISKHLDFVLVSQNNLRTLLVIELDDKSHNKRDAKKRDEFKNRALNAAGIKILRVKAAAAYDAKDIEVAIAKAAAN